MRQAVRLRIFGRVQGVWFRAWTVGEATRLGLDGYVRNRRDGSVEAVFQGPAERIEEAIALCHRGPPAARVERIVVEPIEDVAADGFQTLPTK
ncbi:MAG: acylphosphatase [Pseudomonadota bacterium]